MSISASIDLKLVQRVNQFFAIDIIRAMKNNGWRLENNKKISYLPLCDDGMYNWQEKELSEEEFFNIITHKTQGKEIIGVTLFWKNTDIGVTMLLFPNYEISFNLSLNRRKIDLPNKIDITDASWYFNRILPCFNTDITIIERVAFSQD